MPPTRPVKKKVVSKKQTEDPISIVVFAPSGYGKTSLAANFPRCGFICDSQERGIDFLTRRRLVPDPVWVDDSFDANSHNTFPLIVNRIYDCVTDSSIETLVVESVTGIERVCFQHYKEETWQKGKDNFYSFSAGPKEAAKFLWPDLISAADAVLSSGKNVIITAHAKTKEETDPMGTTAMKYLPYAETDTWNALHRWASCVFFIGKLVEEDKSKRTTRKVAKESSNRILFTEGNAYCEAKNWLGLTGVVQLEPDAETGYNNLMDAIRKTAA